MNLYDILDVSKNATLDEIKTAYKKASMKHHPDRHGGDHDKFLRIQKAYATLENPDTRKYYDTCGGDPQPYKLSTQEAARQELLNLILGMATNEGIPLHINLMNLVIEEIRNRLINIHSHQHILKRKSRRLRKIYRGFGCKEVNSLIQTAIYNVRRQVVQEMFAAKDVTRIHKAMNTMAIEYEYEPPEQASAAFI